jgi:hypothetical protein
MGDWGDLLTMHAQLRRPNLIGDTNRVVGSVQRVYLRDHEGRADVQVAVVNQDGVETATATATVRLPRRDAGEPRDPGLLWAPDVTPEATIYG